MDKFYEIVGHQVIFNLKGKKVEVDLRQAIWPISTFSVFYMLFMKKSGFNDRPLDMLEPLNPNNEAGNSKESAYVPKDLNLPQLKGWLLSVYRRILRSPFGRSFLRNQSIREGELDIFKKMYIPDLPTFFPNIVPEDLIKKLAEDNPIDLEALVKPSDANDQFHFNTISDYVTAYREQQVTPVDVAQKVIRAIKDSSRSSSAGRKPNMRIIIEYLEDDILKMALESTERWKNNEPLSLFDGIPVAVKDEIILAGYPCRQGLPIHDGIHDRIRSRDEEGTMVRKLREGGAIFIGVSNMHQLGIGVTGINNSPLHGTARNPYNPQFPPGGSSAGSASAVAAGLCPIALGADGGGSIRLPAGICGVTGAKATFGRISVSGLSYGTDTLGCSGALCSTVRDSAITYVFLAGKDEEDKNTIFQPSAFLLDFENTDLSGIKLGIDWTYFNHCVPEIAAACQQAAEYLVEKCGATIIDVSISEIKESDRAHLISILTEMYSYHKELYQRFHDELNTDTEMNLDIASTFTAEDYNKAQRQRTRSINLMKQLFKTVDCILTPGFGNFVPCLDDTILEYGFVDLKRLTEIMRYAAQANLTGVPAMSVPVAYSKEDGLPIALQITTPWWREDIMFRIAHALEGVCETQKPQVYYDLLKGTFADPTSDDESL